MRLQQAQKPLRAFAKSRDGGTGVSEGLKSRAPAQGVIVSLSSSTRHRGPNPIDLEIGNHLLARRVAAGLSQTTLADSLGVTFQQVQKYEKGLNRLSAAHLLQLTRILNCTPNDFFNGLDAARKSKQKLFSQDDLKLLECCEGLDKPTRMAIAALARSLPRKR